MQFSAAVFLDYDACVFVCYYYCLLISRFTLYSYHGEICRWASSFYTKPKL